MKSVALVVAVLFCFGGVAAARPEKVDWSQYLETPADRAAAAKSASKPAPVTKVSKKKAAKPKAKKRTAARAKKRRR